MSQKLNVCILFGGKSGEHEVSLQSAKSVYEALDKDKYNVTMVGIDKQGHWHMGESAELILNAGNPKLIALNAAAPKVTALVKNDVTHLVSLDSQEEKGAIDVVFPVMHGTYGEDGSTQGLLELLNVAYIGAGVLGSAVGMDKEVMKRLLRDAGLPIGKFSVLRKYENAAEKLDGIIQELKLPVFVKPANLGSSVGVSKAHDKKELETAIAEAFQYDTKVILEEFIPCREIECSVLGNDHPIASVPGEIIPTHEFYSYEAKYIDPNGAGLKIPAELSPDMIKKAQDLAIKTFQTLECSGLARVDCFLHKETGEFFVNEINTLPGFTKISMYPKLWEASGIGYKELLDRLIQLAVEKKQQKDALKRSRE